MVPSALRPRFHLEVKMGHIWGEGASLLLTPNYQSLKLRVSLSSFQSRANVWKVPGVCALADLGEAWYWSLFFPAPWLPLFPHFPHEHWQRQMRVCGTSSLWQIPHKKHLGSTTEQPVNCHFRCTCARCSRHFYHFAMLHWPMDFFSSFALFLLLLFVSSSLPPCLWQHLDMNSLWTFEPDCAMTKILSFTFCAKVLYKNTSTKKKFRKLGVKIYSQQSI